MEIKTRTNGYLPSLQVLKFRITTLSFEEQALLILRWARRRQSKMVCLANVHMLMEAYWSQEFSSVLDKADMIASDGMPLVWVLKAMGVATQQRVAGMDLFFRLCELTSLCNVGIFFVGSQREVLEKMRVRLTQDYPNLKISGMEPLPFRPLLDSENKALIEQINNSGAGIVLVCLGCPKQEYWMAEHLGKIKAVMLGVGAVFPVYAGLQKRAPRIIRDNGAEWAYRLIQEPRRLWPRYRKTIPPFLYLATHQVISQLRSQIFNPFLIQSKWILGNQIDQDLLANSINLDVDMVPAKLGEILERNHSVDKQDISLALAKQKSNHQKLGEILVDEKVIIKPELDYYLNNQKMTLRNLLINRQLVSKAKLQKISQKINVDKDIDLIEFLIEKKLIPETLINIILAEKYLRIKGFWLNISRLETFTVIPVKPTSVLLDQAHQF